jgi:hypothetical protein
MRSAGARRGGRRRAGHALGRRGDDVSVRARAGARACRTCSPPAVRGGGTGARCKGGSDSSVLPPLHAVGHGVHAERGQPRVGEPEHGVVAVPAALKPAPSQSEMAAGRNSGFMAPASPLQRATQRSATTAPSSAVSGSCSSTGVLSFAVEGPGAARSRNRPRLDPAWRRNVRHAFGAPTPPRGGAGGGYRSSLRQPSGLCEGNRPVHTEP